MEILYLFKMKAFFIFRETETRQKVLDISGNRTFFYFGKWKPPKNFIMF